MHNIVNLQRWNFQRIEGKKAAAHGRDEIGGVGGGAWELPVGRSGPNLPDTFGSSPATDQQKQILANDISKIQQSPTA